MQQLVAFLADNSHQLTNRSKVELVSHGDLVKRHFAVGSRVGEMIGLETGYAHLETKLQELSGQQILNPFGPGVVFPVDNVQHSNGPCGHCL